MLYKHCRCGKLIEYSSGKCQECKAKDEEAYKARRKKYRSNHKPDRELKFYNTKEWINLRNHIVNSYLNMSIYSYYKDGKVVPSEVVHHIVEVRDDWSQRLNKLNLMPVTRAEHQEIHARMDREGKEKIQAELNEMLKKFKLELKIEV